MTNSSTTQHARKLTLFVCAAFLMSSAAIADQVIPDDLIVQGSLCTGLDCVNNENFGFDTIVLKENNLRIFFHDTSSTPGFPPNDWRIIANDSASGGANFFAVEDATAARQILLLEAGAPANSLYVSSTGNVGVGTASPVLDLNITTSDTPAVRLEQTSSGGFTAQTWDIAGNEANFFIRDVTGGSRLPFRIRPGAPTSSIDMSAAGVGIGTASPDNRLHVVDGNSATTAKVENTATTYQNSDPVLYVKQSGDTSHGNVGVFGVGNSSDAGNDGNLFVVQQSGNVGIGTTTPAAQFHTTGTVRFAGIANCSGGIRSDASGTLSCISSTRSLKNVAGVLDSNVALANIMALRPYYGAYTATPDEPEHWLIAEEVAAVDPALVGFQDGEPYTVKTQNVVADLVAVIQDLHRRIEVLEQQVAQ